MTITSTGTLPDTPGGDVRLLTRGVVLGAILLAATWLAYQFFGHPLLQWLYARPGSGQFQRVHDLLHRMPLAYNLDRADARFSAVYRAAALFWMALVGGLLWRSERLDHPPLRRIVLAAAGLSVYLLAPWAWVKLAGILAAVQPCFRGTALMATRDRMRLVWLAVFLAAFVAAPYWSTMPAAWLRLPALILTLALGVAWACQAAAPLQVTLPGGRAYGELVLVAALLWFLFIPGLRVDLPWKGDEDYHVMQVVHLCEAAVPLWLPMLALLAACACWGRSYPGRGPGAIMALMVLLASIGGAGYLNLEGSMLRYPYLLRWLEALPVQALFPVAPLFYRESLFRITSVLAVVAVGWLVAQRFPGDGRGLRLAAGLACATIPTFQYYGTTLYLELPAVAAMTMVALHAGPLIELEGRQVRSAVAWPALLLLGFLKETTLPVLAAFILCRGARHLLRPGWRARVGVEVVNALLLAFPLIVYMVFRTSAHLWRGYAGNWSNAWSPQAWRVVLGSWIEQSGAIVLLAAGGIYFLARVGRRWEAVLFSLWILLMTAFNVADRPVYFGYSRFNLFIMPPLIAAAVALLSHWAAWRPALAWAVIAMCLAVNAWLTPLNRDGSRTPGWGSPLTDTAEHYYPYRDTLTWLRKVDPEGSILFAGSEYPYYCAFYFRSLRWEPRHAQPLTLTTVDTAMRAADTGNFDHVVYQVAGDAETLPPAVASYELSRVFATQSNMLGVYSRMPVSGIQGQ